MTDTRTALVIGGGIAGPSAAMALQAAGIRRGVAPGDLGSDVDFGLIRRGFAPPRSPPTKEKETR